MDENSGLVLYEGGSTSSSAATRRLPDRDGRVPKYLRVVIGEGAGVYEVPIQRPIVVGRNSSSQSVDVDLTPFEAVENGVSRQHLRIELFGERLMVKDLNSVNGSRHNGVAMTPNHVYELQHGDELKIGRIKMRVYFLYD